MSFNIEYIEKLVKLLEESNLSEMMLQDGEQIIEMRKPNGTVSASYSGGALASSVQSTVLQAHQVQEEVTEEKEIQKTSKTITSPMVGTFYSSSTPGGKPFVQVGDTVSAGQVVCIIEAMKLMNEIESEVSGKITKICIEDGQPVEYGQVLMYVE